MRSRSMLAWLVLLSLATAPTLLVPRAALAQQRVILIPVRGAGADEATLGATTTSLRRRLEERGFQVGLLQSAPPEGASVSDLGDLASRNNADYVVDAELQDFAGMTSLQLRVVSREGALVGEDANLARAETLPQDAAMALANALEALPTTMGPPTAPGVDSPFGPSTTTAPVETEPVPQVRAQPVERPRARRRRPAFPDRHFWLGAFIEPAMGTNRSALNLLTGIRAEYQWRGLTVGASFGYSYVKDWEPRSDPSYHSMSIFAMIGYKIRLGSDRLFLPLLAGGGYIPGNGGLLRFEAGLSIRPIDRLEIRLIFVCPNFWFLDEEMVLFTSISLGLNVGF